MDELWKRKDVIVIDGGFATEAQARGEDINTVSCASLSNYIFASYINVCNLY